MAKMRKQYWLIGDKAPEYFFSPLQSPPTPTDLDLDDWVVVEFYPKRVKEDVTFTKVEFTEKGSGQVAAIYTRAGGAGDRKEAWNLVQGYQHHYTIQDTDPEPPSGRVRGITITNSEHLGSGQTDVHEFKLYFSDGGSVDPELINKG